MILSPAIPPVLSLPAGESVQGREPQRPQRAQRGIGELEPLFLSSSPQFSPVSSRSGCIGREERLPSCCDALSDSDDRTAYDMHEDRQRVIQTTRQTQRRTALSAYDGVLDALPSKIRNALLGAGITSLAQVDALADVALQRIRWIGPETVQYLRALARHEQVAHSPMRPGECMELHRDAATIADEIAGGRLAPDLTARTIHGPMTISALAERWDDPLRCTAADLNLARALMHALRFRTLDAEFRALFAGLTDPQRAMVRYRHDPVAQLTLDQCAARLGLSPTRVRIIAIEARETLLVLCGCASVPAHPHRNPSRRRPNRRRWQPARTRR